MRETLGQKEGERKGESKKQAQRAEEKNFSLLAFCSVWGFDLFLNSQEGP